MLKAGVDLNLGIEIETLEFKKSTGELKEAFYLCNFEQTSARGTLFWSQTRWNCCGTGCDRRVFAGSESENKKLH